MIFLFLFEFALTLHLFLYKKNLFSFDEFLSIKLRNYIFKFQLVGFFLKLLAM